MLRGAFGEGDIVAVSVAPGSSGLTFAHVAAGGGPPPPTVQDAEVLEAYDQASGSSGSGSGNGTSVGGGLGGPAAAQAA